MNEPSLTMSTSHTDFRHSHDTPLTATTTTTTSATTSTVDLKEALFESKDGALVQLDDHDGQEIQASVKVSPDALESVIASTTKSHKESTNATESTAVSPRSPSLLLLSPRNSSLCGDSVLATPSPITVTGQICATEKNVAQVPLHQQTQPQRQNQQTNSPELPLQQHSFPLRQHINYSHTHYHHSLHHHHHGTGSVHSEKKQNKNRRFSFSKVGAAPLQNIQEDRKHSQQPQDQRNSFNTMQDNNYHLADDGAYHGIRGSTSNGSWGLLIDPKLKCCNVRPPPSLTVSTSISQQAPRNEHEDEASSSSSSSPSLSPSTTTSSHVTQPRSPSFESTSPSSTDGEHLAAELTEEDSRGERSDAKLSGAHQDGLLLDIHHHYDYHDIEQQQDLEHPRVCKMLVKHHAVKLDWKVPEPIKAGGETLRGVLVISAKELSEVVVGKKRKNKGKGKHGRGNDQLDTRKQKKKHDRTVRIEHIEIDLTGVEEVTTGAGLLSRTRTDHHCFLHKTQVLCIEELKWIHDPSSCASATAYPVTAAIPIVQSVNTLPTRSNTTTSAHTLNLPSPTTSVVPESFQPGCIAPGTQQGITFQMRVPEKVGGTFKSAHASISYHLTANVHIRLGKEAFVLQHPLPLSLFELVQVRAATKIASPHDVSPYQAPVPEFLMADDILSVRSSTGSTTYSSPGGRQSSSVRFVIPKANSVLGTAAVKPYSLWGLGPATSSQRHHYTYSNSHGYGRYRHNQSHPSHQRQASHSPTTVTTAAGSITSSAMADPVMGVTRSHSPTSALSPQKHLFHEESSAVGHQHHRMERSQENNAMISAEDQYRQQQKQQQQQSQIQSSRDRHSPRHTENMDGLDEVGFGAHIDKSVAAAGDNVTLDMFVVKSDLMKVVDIKVSLVETIQVFSLLDIEGACSINSPIASKARAVDGKEEEEQHKGQHISKSKSGSRRRLVDTHVVKIAKDYVPAQSEESHANDNHLKGYYEDYEDFRTAKSLSMYKLGMRIPETALTIMDRELLKVEYMFVIKFFFKGRMGAFLELPIEIISQYNHNRISTISGAISCVSNSVQIALPPVPILVKRSELIQSDLNDIPVEDSNAFMSPNIAGKYADFDPWAEAEAVADTADADAEVNQEKESGKFQDFIIMNCEDSITAAEAASIERNVSSMDQINMLPNPILNTVGGLAASVKTAPAKDSTQEVAFMPKIGTRSSSLRGFERKPSASEAPSHEHTKRALSMNTRKKTPVTVQTTHSPIRGNEGQAIVSSSRLSKAESEACKSNVARIAAALMGKELAATNSGNGFADPKKKSSTESTGAVPKIIINNVHASRCTNVSGNSSLSSSRRSSQDKGSPQPGSLVSNSTRSASSHGSTTTSPSTNTTKVASPALPLLFDLTSAALPSTPSSHVPSPIVIPSPSKSSGSGSCSNVLKSNKVTVGSENITTWPIMTCPSPIAEGPSSFRRLKDIDTPQPQQQLLNLHARISLSTRSTGASSSSSSAVNSGSRSDDDSSHGGSDSKSCPSNNGLVAKIAKSLSSPLLRSRAGAGSAIAGGGGSSASPNGSITNLQLVSPQQQSTAFTLAATTLSALMLLSSVGQTAVGNDGNYNCGNSNSSGAQHARRPSQPSPLSQRSLKSCLKKRRGSAPPIVVTTSSLSCGDNLASNGMSTLKAPQSSSGRKKVTFAKGLTPLPSPTASQVFFPETEYSSKMGQQQQHLSSYGSSYSSPVSDIALEGSLTVTGVSAAFNRAPANASTSSPSTSPSSSSQSVSAEEKSIISTQINPDNTQNRNNGLMRIKSPNSVSPRARMHHPFDGHPSRLSPLEKRHLDFQIKVQVPLRGNRPEQERVQEQQRSVAEVREGVDVEEEDEADEDDDDMEYEEEDDTDEEDDERETEEERVERRRQARVAWLAKYGDAFKQVYGAVPDLPPI